MFNANHHLALKGFESLLESPQPFIVFFLMHIWLFCLFRMVTDADYLASCLPIFQLLQLKVSQSVSSV